MTRSLPVYLSHCFNSGGPGCSGLIGFFTEHGPFRVDENLNLYENPFAWNHMANMLFVEQPAGSGFSIRDPKDKSAVNDEQSAKDNFALIQAFYERFPERKSNKLYLASESYGGHYIPQLSLEILKHDKDHDINFAGFMLGNPYVDPYTNFIAEIEAVYGHGLLPLPVMQTWRDACSSHDTWESAECQKVVEHIYEIVEPGFNVYALDFPVCTAVTTSSSSNARKNMRGHRKLENAADDDPSQKAAVTQQVQTLLSMYSVHTPPYLPKEDTYEPCTQLYMREYLSRADVQKAIGVKTHKKMDWMPCNITLGYDTEDVETSVVPAYQQLVDMGKEGNHSLKMLIFSGDDDSVCATDGTQAWLWELGVPAKELWRPWKVNDQIAGFWTTFDLQSQASLGFATVHGAGHEVPTYRPMEAFELFRLFLHS